MPVYSTMFQTALMRLLVALLVTVASAARPTQFDSHSSPTHARLLLQQQTQQNCAPPRPLASAARPFCFQPLTISPEARAFLANTSAAVLPSEDPPAVVQQKAQNFYRELSEPLHAAAVEAYLQTPVNSSIGGVPVVIAAAKGVNASSNADTKVLLYLHGGGYIIGSCQWLLHTVAATAAGANLTIICPEYHLAPAYPFPAGLNDALTLYKTMVNQEGYKARNIVLLGDSAGGGMVAAVAVQLQREGVALPAALGMFSPWADLTALGDTTVTLVGVDPVITGRDPSANETVTGSAILYVNGNASLAVTDPLVSPLLADYATLFAGNALPPTLIQVGLRETLLSDAVLLYHKMKAAAPAPGRVVLSPYEGMWHVFQGYIQVPEAAAASREMADFFTRALAS